MAGRLSGAMIVTPFSVTVVSPARDSSTLPPSALAAMSTMIEPLFIARTASAVTSSGGRRPGTWAVVMTTSMVAMWPFSSSCWAFCSSARQRAGIAALAGRVDGRLEDDEAGAERLGLLLRLLAHVVGLDDGAQAAGGADGLQPRHADAQDEHVGGLGRAGRRRQQREVAAVGGGRDEDRLVAADVGLRAERVHRLRRAERARQRVEADGGHAGDRPASWPWPDR